MTTVLLLAGTAEARMLAAAMADMPGVRGIASLAGATRHPEPLALPTRIGGFGGDAGFAAFLDAQGIDAVLDATHPFAARISARSWAICRDRGLPYLQVLRPAWHPGLGDRWTMIADEAEATRHIRRPATVFLATGRQTLAHFAALSDCRLYCRQIDAPEVPFPFANGAFLIGRPPFSVPDEAALFSRLKIDWLVVKNAGGQPSRSKLDAARQIGLPVLMIARPSATGAPEVETVAAALQWLRQR
ncbi:cobalt-precorrin-6A reductase [Pseudoruegeria sp. SK021]|uniref:cobalt-precorrin-6A reductase n=1 Tax=Pseudoruegeria sp. SK021 TaxID=1933035 RepID=UPI000A226E95|nr:cobalt-precorrin-6A reductase [Pseudoruegeria sp. SK021]OSP54283.1 cobalt-precorrin-6A reductase [Pseudoruegeria sp. SK021]